MQTCLHCSHDIIKKNNTLAPSNQINPTHRHVLLVLHATHVAHAESAAHTAKTSAKTGASDPASTAWHAVHLAHVLLALCVSKFDHQR